MTQNLQNHARFVPLYHFVLALMILAFLGLSIWNLIRSPGLGSTLSVLLGLILVLVYYYERGFPLAVQDRLIRLEMRLRLRETLPAELQGRILDLTPDQLIGLRFAGDGELAGLVQRVLDGELIRRQEIKKAIRDWQADDYRC
jgi:hypothetical protein